MHRPSKTGMTRYWLFEGTDNVAVLFKIREYLLMDILISREGTFITFGRVPLDIPTDPFIFLNVQRIPFVAYDHLHGFDLVKRRRDLSWRAGNDADDFPAGGRFSIQ